MYKVIEVRDTRQIGTDYKPISGTGRKERCDHCKKLHEVHVLIQHVSTFEQIIVGTTCANKLGVLDANPFSTKSLKASAINRRMQELTEMALS